MFIVFQQPALDLREFIMDSNGNSGSYRAEIFNSRQSITSGSAPFLKGFGSLKSRRASENWDNEELFYNAGNAVKMPSFTNHINNEVLSTDRYGGYGICKSRRVFYNQAVLRFEVAYFIRIDSEKRTFSPDARNIVSSLMRQKVRIFSYTSKAVEEVNFFSANFRKKLCNLIERASLAKGASEDYLIKPCKPVIYIEYPLESRSDKILMPGSSLTFKLQGEYEGIIVDFFSHSNSGNPVDIWCVGYNGVRPSENVRELRIGILKLHSFIQCAATLSSNVSKVLQNNRGYRSDSLHEFSNRFIKFFERGVYNDAEIGETQRTILTLFLSTQKGVIRDIIFQLKREVELFNREESADVSRGSGSQTMIESATIIYGGINMTKSYGDIIGGSGIMIIDSSQISQIYNNVNIAPINEDKKKALNQVNDEVLKMIEALPEDKKEDAVKALKELNEQATKEKPNKRWFDVSVDGLMEAAKAVSDVISGPAVTAIKALIALFP